MANSYVKCATCAVVVPWRYCHFAGPNKPVCPRCFEVATGMLSAFTLEATRKQKALT